MGYLVKERFHLFRLGLSLILEYRARRGHINGDMKEKMMKDTAKIIVLAGMWKRAFAHLIDLLCGIALSCLIYFPLVLPAAVDLDSYRNNTKEMAQIQLGSGLYVPIGGQAVNPITNITLTGYQDLLELDVPDDEGGTTAFYPLDAVHEYWTAKAADYGNEPYSEQGFAEDVLRVGESVSNIASYSIGEDGHSEITMIDENDSYTTYLFLRDTVYADAVASLNNDPDLIRLNKENNANALQGVLWAIPLLFGGFAVFFLVIPLCLKDGQTLGKKVMKLVVLSADGYTYRKWKLIIRFVVYFAVEFVGMIVSFGATLLISYTMTMFTKKRRSIHDYAAGSVVADSENSLWFDDPVEEELFNAQRKKGAQDAQ